MAIGTIDRYDTTRGFGFIRIENKKLIFFHISNVEGQLNLFLNDLEELSMVSLKHHEILVSYEKSVDEERQQLKAIKVIRIDKGIESSEPEEPP